MASVVQVFRAGEVLSYDDAVVTMLVAERLADGLSHLGAVLMPFPLLAMMPLATFDPLADSGIAGAVVSMACYVICNVLVYRIVRRLLRAESAAVSTIGAVSGTTVFALNPNILYLQSTPMADMAVCAVLLGAAHSLQLWAQAPHRYGHLVRAGLCLALGTLTGYAFWVLLPIAAVLVVLRVAHRERGKPLSVRRRRIEDNILVFGLVAVMGVVAWLSWNWLLSGGPLTFWSGANGEPDRLLPAVEPVTWNAEGGPVSLGLAVVASVPIALAVAAVPGAVALAASVRRTRRLLEVAMVFAIIAAGAWCVYAIDDEPRLVHTGPVPASVHSARAAVMAVPLVAILVAYLAARLAAFVPRVRTGAGSVLLVAAVAGAVTWAPDPAAVPRETSDSAADQQRLSKIFVSLYDDGDVLMATSGNERLALLAVPRRSLIDENLTDNTRWLRALSDPAAAQVRWIVMRCGDGPDYAEGARRSDNVCTAFAERPQALDGYRLMHRMDDESSYQIYRIRS
ncbi:hypothetical protein [Plantactinospora sp. KLBMP9567]|uniref:hypothetical protein n=1 Tax=Plantactinospora sp. KLBMP9567 TaxID=3085900 RepID=UPI0029818711|nr:hypothetical protein [Plantactinospora sp. KLBMP9567]MDW5328347.1 hypothetical protein [Plantactinospora sp. KLBMP9567]